MENRPSPVGKKEIAATVDKKKITQDCGLHDRIEARFQQNEEQRRDMTSIVDLIGIEASHQYKDTSIWLHWKSVGISFELGSLTRRLEQPPQ